MIGHQSVGVDGALALGCVFLQPAEIRSVVVLAEEARLAIVAALNEVQRYPRKHDPWASRHEAMFVDETVVCPRFLGFCPRFLMARYAPLRLPLPAVRAIAQFWEVMADQANTVLFLLVGVIIGVNLHGFGFWDMLLDILGIYLCLQLVRFASTGLLFPALRRCGFGLRANQFVALGWSGIRGAVSLAMALVLVHRNLLPDQVGEQILILTAGVVLSTLVNGIGARPLLGLWEPYYLAPRSRGLSTTAAFVTLGRKLARLCFALLKNGTDFNPNFRQTA